MDSYLHNKKLLLVDDEPELLKMIASILYNDGFENIVTASTAADAISTAKNGSPDLVVLDVMLPDGDGFSVMREIREFTNVPVIFLFA